MRIGTHEPSLFDMSCRRYSGYGGLGAFALGAHEKHRFAGVTALLLNRIVDVAASRIEEAELSWIVEDNIRSLRATNRPSPIAFSIDRYGHSTRARTPVDRIV